MKTFLSIVCFAGIIFAQYDSLPNLKFTPGDIAFVPESLLCKHGYTASIRHVTKKMKHQVRYWYNIPDSVPEGTFEIDHLVSLELGGSNSIKNLWPQPYAGKWGARTKDVLENKLHKLVCNGKITLSQAQYEVMTNWIEAYKKYVKKVP
jgi:hypothetical protein